MIKKVLGNRYEIIREIGSGGMADVYLAHCKLLDRNVAIKVLKPSLATDKEFLTRFETEAKSAARLSHPNIVSIYDVGKDEDLNYIVMEYVEGITLKEFLDENKVLPWQQCVKYAMQICKALEHAHKNGVIHRDIKPHNIIMTPDGVLKVTDFGIAHAVTKKTVTISGNTIGSVHYFSPEQARGVFTDAKSDIYSLGIVMYEMMTGVLPFDGESHIAIAIMHIQKTPVPPKEYNITIPLSVERIILKAMAKSPSDRYQCAEDMEKDMQAVLDDPENAVPSFDSDNKDFSETMMFDKKQTEIIKKRPSNIAKTSPRMDAVTPKKIKEVADENEDKKDEVNIKKDKKITALIITTCVILALVLIAGVSSLMGFSPFKSGEAVTVPNLIGLDYEEAKAEYKDKNINIIMVQEVASTEYDEGVIVTQSPSVGTSRKTPFDIRVNVSKGSSSQKMGNYERQEYDSVSFELKKLGYVIKVQKEASESIPINTVIKTVPSAGETIKTGETVILYVSSGPEVSKIPVPNVVGQTLSNAKKILENNNLRVGNITNSPSSEEAGTVISQSVEKNTSVDEYTLVNLVISSGSSSSSSGGSNNIITVQIPQNKETTNVKVIENGSVIHNQTHNKSEGKFSVTLRGSGTVKYEVYFDDVLKTQETITL